MWKVTAEKKTKFYYVVAELGDKQASRPAEDRWNACLFLFSKREDGLFRTKKTAEAFASHVKMMAAFQQGKDGQELSIGVKVQKNDA